MTGKNNLEVLRELLDRIEYSDCAVEVLETFITELVDGETDWGESMYCALREWDL